MMEPGLMGQWDWGGEKRRARLLDKYPSTPCTGGSCGRCGFNLGGKFELICFGFFFFPTLTKIHGYYVGGYLFFVLMRLVLAYERTSGWLSDFELFCVYYSIHVLTFLFVGLFHAILVAF